MIIAADPAAAAVALAQRRSTASIACASTSSASPHRSAGPASTTQAIRQTRLAIGLPHPATTPDAAALATAWLADDDVRAFLEVHEWEGSTYLNGDRWSELVDVAAALDRASGGASGVACHRSVASRCEVGRLPDGWNCRGAQRRTSRRSKEIGGEPCEMTSSRWVR